MFLFIYCYFMCVPSFPFYSLLSLYFFLLPLVPISFSLSCRLSMCLPPSRQFLFHPSILLPTSPSLPSLFPFWLPSTSLFDFFSCFYLIVIFFFTIIRSLSFFLLHSCLFPISSPYLPSVFCFLHFSLCLSITASPSSLSFILLCSFFPFYSIVITIIA